MTGLADMSSIHSQTIYEPDRAYTEIEQIKDVEPLKGQCSLSASVRGVACLEMPVVMIGP